MTEEKKVKIGYCLYFRERILGCVFSAVLFLNFGYCLNVILDY